MALFGSLLHQLHHQLVRLSHHCRPIHAYQFITGPQASILICGAILHYVADVDLKAKQEKANIYICCLYKSIRLHVFKRLM